MPTFALGFAFFAMTCVEPAHAARPFLSEARPTCSMRTKVIRAACACMLLSAGMEVIDHRMHPPTSALKPVIAQTPTQPASHPKEFADLSLEQK